MKNSTKPICGAKAKQTGKPCEKPPLKGKTRCRLHGGATPTGTRGNRAHGIYAAALSPEEQALWEEVQLGSVDDEIRLCKIRVRRAEIAQNAVQANPTSTDNTAGMELSEIRSMEESVQTVIKRQDFTAVIDRLMGRIGMLEKTRAELIAAAQAAGEGVDDVAQRVSFALKAMVEVETKQPSDDDEE
jgi:hypothetical protein